MAILNFNANICNYTTKVVSKSAIPGSLSTNNYEYIDLEMIPDAGYYMPISNFGYEQNEYIDYVTFMQNGSHLRARAYLKQFNWPTERTSIEVLIKGCAEKVILTTTTAAPTTQPPTTTTTTTTLACPYISGYFINKSIIEDRGENRLFKVYGVSGATFTYIVTDSSINTIQTDTITIGNSGTAEIYLNIPRITSGTEQYTVTLSVAEDCIMQLQTQPKAFKLFQGEDIKWKGDDFECCEEADVLVTTYCDGVDQYGTYTDGQCSTYNQLIEANSVACGYVATTTTTTTTTTTAPPVLSATITGPTTGVTGTNITLIGEDNNFTGSTWAWTGGAANGLTSKSITFNESSTGTVTYGVTIDGTYTDTHNVTWSATPPTLTCAGTGFSLSDGNTGDTITASDYTITNGTVQSITPATYQSGSTTYSIDILVPAGYSNAGSTITCTDTAIGLNQFTCTDAGFAVADGTTGDTIGINTDATVIAGTLNSVSPAVYQSGSATYTANITVPAGYSNAGATLTTCTDTATGSAALPTFTCTDANFQVSDGTVGDTIGIGSDATVSAGTLNSVSPATYQAGSTTYTANITVPSGYSNAGATLTTCTNSATGTYPSFTTNSPAETSSSSACLVGTGTTRYHDGSGTYPTIGDTIYLTSTGTGTVGAGYYKAGALWIEVNSSGVVIDEGPC